MASERGADYNVRGISEWDDPLVVSNAYRHFIMPWLIHMVYVRRNAIMNLSFPRKSHSSLLMGAQWSCKELSRPWCCQPMPTWRCSACLNSCWRPRCESSWPGTLQCEKRWRYKIRECIPYFEAVWQSSSTGFSFWLHVACQCRTCRHRSTWTWKMQS